MLSVLYASQIYVLINIVFLFCFINSPSVAVDTFSNEVQKRSHQYLFFLSILDGCQSGFWWHYFDQHTLAMYNNPPRSKGSKLTFYLLFHFINLCFYGVFQLCNGGREDYVMNVISYLYYIIFFSVIYLFLVQFYE